MKSLWRFLSIFAVGSVLLLTAVKMLQSSPKDRNIHVVVASSRSNFQGLAALLNSIRSNTEKHVKHHIIVLREDVGRLGVWLATHFPYLDVNIIAFDPRRLDGKIKIRGKRQSLANPMNYARYYLPELLPDAVNRVIYLDDDVIVQGDLDELDTLPLGGYLAAFGSDCTWISQQYHLFENHYQGFVNFQHPAVAELGLDPDECSFNAGVFVADIAQWRRVDITRQLEEWLELNTKEDIYGSGPAGGGSQPPMMIVFYKQFAKLPPLWHIRGLGSPMTSAALPEALVQTAKLLHWTGREKPWRSTSARYKAVFDKYALEQPLGV